MSELFRDRRRGTRHSPTYGEYAKRGDSPQEYTREYRRGYRHSSTAVNPDPNRGEGAWRDGFTDAAEGRAKYALRNHRFGTGDPVPDL